VYVCAFVHIYVSIFGACAENDCRQLDTVTRSLKTHKPIEWSLVVAPLLVLSSCDCVCVCVSSSCRVLCKYCICI